MPGCLGTEPQAGDDGPTERGQVCNGNARDLTTLLWLLVRRLVDGEDLVCGYLFKHLLDSTGPLDLYRLRLVGFAESEVCALVAG